MNRKTGFTLIEVVLVITIIGIISALIVPKVDNINSSIRLRAATDKLKDDLKYIQRYAVSRHDTTWLVVNSGDNSYGIFTGSSSSNRQLILDPSTNTQAMIDFDDYYRGVQISSVNFGGNDEFFFDWRGTPSNGGYVVLNSTRIITVSTETGYIYESN